MNRSESNEVPRTVFTDPVEAGAYYRAFELGHIVGETALSPDTPWQRQRQLALAVRLSSERQIEEAITKAQYDSLTGLYTRHVFIERLRERVGQAASPGELGLLFIDLNDFKPINDTHGHEAGDRVLEESGRRIRGITRTETDVISRWGKDPAGQTILTAGRYGGDEIVVLVELTPRHRFADDPADTHLDSESYLANIGFRILTAIRDIPKAVELPDRPLCAAIGIAVWTPGQSAEDFLATADKAMYYAKMTSKENPVSAAPIVSWQQNYGMYPHFQS